MPYDGVYKAAVEQREDSALDNLILPSQLTQSQQLPCLYARVPKGQPQQLQVQLPPRGPAAAAAAGPSAGSAAEATSTDEAARAGKQQGGAAAAGTGGQVKTQPFHTTSQLAVIALAPRFLGDDGLVYYFTPGMKVTIPAGANTSDSVQPRLCSR